jgi:AcrR family transcriptional regulator
MARTDRTGARIAAVSKLDESGTGDGVGRRHTERSEATRQRLLSTARALFAERGYDATPIEEILTHTGLSKGAFYHHFADKRELLAAVYEELERELTAMLAGVGRDLRDPMARIDRGCQAFLDVCLDPAVHRIALVDAPAVLGWRRWREIDAQHGFGLLLAGLRSAARAGRIPAEHLVERGHLLLASLMEAALLVGASAEPAVTRATVGRVVSEQIWALAGEAPPIY